MQRDGEEGVDELLALRREASGAGTKEDSCAVLTRKEGCPKEHWCFGEAVLVVELRRHRCRLCQLVVDEMLTESESRTGERNCVSSAIAGLGVLVAMENACACVGVAVGPHLGLVLSRQAKCSTCISHVVHQHGHLAFNVPNKHHSQYLIRPFPLLVKQCKVDAQSVRH